jgi:hypothetical protein
MSNKATCPACDAHTSSVWTAFADGDPCPYCGLPAGAAEAFENARQRGADEALIEQAARAEQRATAAEERCRVLERALQEVGRRVESVLKPDTT